jgi:hypothetical protein
LNVASQFGSTDSRPAGALVPDQLSIAEESRMKNRGLMIMAALGLVVQAAAAQPNPSVDVQRAPGQVTASGTATVTATVVGIERATRTVTLKTSKGKTVQLEVGEEARNFDQLAVGDIVTAQYREAISLSLKKGAGPLSVTERESSDRSAAGGKPGGTVGREVTVIADVVAVSAPSKTVTLKGPQGNQLDLLVDDPEQLKAVRKGDRVQVVYTEAMAISVEPAKKK